MQPAFCMHPHTFQGCQHIIFFIPLDPKLVSLRTSMSHLLSEMKSQVAKQAFPSVTDAFGQSALVAIVWLKKPASSLTMLISIKVVTSKNEFAFVRTTHRNRWFQCEATLRTFTIHECSSLDLTSMT